ncbi:FAD-dependent oxidoreductase [Mycolicibacterium sp. BiH015]|uniref:NAD(P)/FAD-dependent oxidoreductase n=1 Tax=Mycolicibacterium sp. BiH015 TaxID=3018808 RepID=UPI0022E055D8|nr:FAD-dependent oxidoreductase [Mycolicibacterium sp. BiH015]MDA2892619.1 FAD-dependent oxidoreductase [Mycolicibacterium sp. BiH015]
MAIRRVAVIGAGMSGAACAQALDERGIAVDMFERGRTGGGRMSSPTVHERRVDLGAAYLTAKDESFSAVVEDWVRRGLARPWTDTFDVVSPGGRDVTSGPVRYAAAHGLRSLVKDLLPEEVRYDAQTGSVNVLDHDAVVLAMPDPQAARLIPDAFAWVDYEPVIAVAAGWPERCWDVRDAAFVNDNPDISFVADDGARRGDRAPVLVVHTTAARARRHLDSPDDAVAPTLNAVRRLLGVAAEPVYTHVHRWTFAKPVGTHGDDAYGLLPGDRPVGVCGDAWCPSGAPRVESAWLSGRRLAGAIADMLS